MASGKFGLFDVEHEAGRGGMGVVYRARHVATGVPVALKVLPGGGDASRNAIKRFEREALALAALEHPAIVRYVGHGCSDGGDFYLAMDWLEGEDLGARLERGAVSPFDAVALGATLAGALAEVHGNGLVHRDLKPSNVLLVDGDIRRPVLLDFGIARVAAATAMTRTGQVIGTPHYMAPEQIAGARHVDGRADLFALGVILFECLSGTRPFDGDRMMAVLAKILVEQTPPLSSPQGPLPGSLVTLVEALLEKDPVDRPPSAGDAARSFERCAAELEARDATVAATLLGAVSSANEKTALTGREQRLIAIVLAEEPDTATGLAATVSPEQVADMRGRLRGAAQAHGGEMCSLGPRRFMVTFPGDGEATDRAGGAARCALAMAAVWPESSVALAVGRSRTAEAPVGEVIDRAAALLTPNGAGGVRTDEATAALLELRFRLRTEEGACAIVGERRAHEQPRTLLGKPTRFAGRRREMATLLATLDEVVEDGVGRALLVTGVSGSGKSRLRHELVARIAAREDGIRILLARAEPLRSGSALALCAEVVRAWAGLDGADDAVSSAIAARVEQRFSPAERDDTGAFLREIVGLPSGIDAGPRLAALRKDARLLGEHLRAAFSAMLRAESAAGPVVVILEDLHWGDPQSVRFFDVALRDATSCPLFVLALARPEVHERFPALWKARGLSEMALHPLSARVCAELARQILGDVDPAMLERIVEQSDGNALHLEELIRAAAEGDLTTLPRSVVAMLQARLERLDAGARHVLRAASVLGDAFLPGTLRALVGDDDVDVDAALSRLLTAEVMVPRADGAEVRYAFRHAAVREAASAMLTDEDRALGHGLAAAHLEAQGERDALLLAEHYRQAGDAPNAARCYARAARQALDRSDFETAIAHAERAVGLGAEGLARVDAGIARGRALHCLGRLVEATDELEAVLATIPEEESERRLEAMRELWTTGVYRQSSAVIHRVADEALELARRHGRNDYAADAECALALADHCDERCERALERFRHALELAGERPSFVFSLSSILMYHAGLHEEGIAVANKLLVVARDMRDSVTMAALLANLGVLHAALGRYEEGRSAFAEARAVSDDNGLPMLDARTTSLSTGHFLDVFDPDAAAERAGETREIGRRLEFTTPRVSATLDLGFVALARGDAAEARRRIDEVAGEVTSGTGFHGWLWRLRVAVLRAELAATVGSFAEALSLADEAATTARRLGRTKYAMAAETVRARALTGLGRRDEAVARLTDGVAQMRAFPEPAVRLRVATALLALTDDDRARDVAEDAAACMEAGLPFLDRGRFRGAVDPLLRGGAPPR